MIRDGSRASHPAPAVTVRPDLLPAVDRAARVRHRGGAFEETAARSSRHPQSMYEIHGMRMAHMRPMMEYVGKAMAAAQREG
jgi:hypothetical protein